MKEMELYEERRESASVPLSYNSPAGEAGRGGGSDFTEEERSPNWAVHLASVI